MPFLVEVGCLSVAGVLGGRAVGGKGASRVVFGLVRVMRLMVACAQFFVSSTLAPVLLFRRRIKSVADVLEGIRQHGLTPSNWEAARKSTLKVNILQVFTIDFSEIQFIVNHNSQSDGQNKSAKSGMNLQKKTTHIVSLQRKRKDTKDNGILL